MKRWLTVVVIVIFLAAALIVAMYASVRQLTGFGWPVYGAASIWMPYDRLFLVRNGDHFAAVKFVEPTADFGCIASMRTDTSR